MKKMGWRCLIAFLAAVPLVFANLPELEKGYSANSPFQKSDLVDVNLFSGNPVVSIPIASYQAGDMPWSVSLTYNTPQWKVFTVIRRFNQQIQGKGGDTANREVTIESSFREPVDGSGKSLASYEGQALTPAVSGWGWTVGGDFRIVEHPKATLAGEGRGCGATPPAPGSIRFVRTFDGGEHDLYQVSQDPAPREYVTRDLSFIRVRTEERDGQPVEVIYLPDGRRAEPILDGAKAVGQKLYDRFGNFVETQYTYEVDGQAFDEPLISSMEDSEGRTVAFFYTVQSPTDTFFRCCRRFASPRRTERAFIASPMT